ncbi:MAG: hypothetical protein QX189_00140 [Methylococcales bacterium]
MNNNPNPELIDEENPEWTAAMFNTAKTAAELLPKNNHFAELCGILTSEKSVSLEEMEQAIALQGLERFNDCSFTPNTD